MMKDLASSTLKIEEVYDPEKTYNVCTAGEAANLYSAALPFRLLNSIFGIQEGEKTVVSQPDACRKLGSYLKEENLPLLKEYVKTCLYSDLSMMTDTASLDAAQEYQTAAGGMEKKRILSGPYLKQSRKNLVSSAAVYSVKPILTRMPNRMWLPSSGKS